MTPSPLLLLLEALVGLVEERLEREKGFAPGDLATVAAQVHRLVSLLARLAEATEAAETRKEPERSGPLP